MKIYPVFLLFFVMSCQPWTPIELSTSKMMSVHVSGAVIQEGWIQLPNFATIEDLLALIALDDNADLSRFHSATILRNQDRIIIPFQSDQPCISLNAATLEQLMTLSGIGAVSAQRILDYRQNEGLFRRIEEIMNIKGIKQKTFEKIQADLCL